jgi:hypothetical protein
VGDPAPWWGCWPHHPGCAGRVHRGSRCGTPDSHRAVPSAGRIGALLGWDQQRPVWNAESYVHRLSAADRAQSTAAPGTPDGRLSVLYRFENEQLSELRNETVHAFSSLSIRPTPGGYLAYLAIYVKPVHRFTRLYMGAIAPFRRLVVYPAIIRTVQSAWAERYGGESGDEL